MWLSGVHSVPKIGRLLRKWGKNGLSSSDNAASKHLCQTVHIQPVDACKAHELDHVDPNVVQLCLQPPRSSTHPADVHIFLS